MSQPLKRYDGQVRDFLEVAQVHSQYGVALLDGSHSDHEVVEGQHVSSVRFLPIDLSQQPSCPIRHWMDRHKAHQLLDVLSSALRCFRRPGPVNSMDEFGHRDRR
jgi:hypothetical protein